MDRRPVEGDPQRRDNVTASPYLHYAAFISYRHVEPDRKRAIWLHAAIENYRVPKRLNRELSLPRRLGRVFRDEDELAASPHLNADIEQALKQSRYLIIVCSLGILRPGRRR